MDDRKRPITIVAFEVLNVVPAMLEMLFNHTGSAFEELFTTALWVGLTLWVTRGRSRLARLIYTCVMAIGVAALLGASYLGYVPSDVRMIIALWFAPQMVLLLALLWSPPTTDWLGKRGGTVAA